jgi:nucleotide-binding universal stress UspA family protein
MPFYIIKISMITPKKILVCTDGEEHTIKAEDYAISLAEKFASEIVCLYVINPFLKRYTNEIYAINRNECREHLDRALKKEGEEALKRFLIKSNTKKITSLIKMRYGDPEQEILDEIEKGGYDLIIMGAKLLKGWKERFESFNLPEKIFKKSSISMIFVR